MVVDEKNDVVFKIFMWYFIFRNLNFSFSFLEMVCFSSRVISLEYEGYKYVSFLKLFLFLPTEVFNFFYQKNRFFYKFNYLLYNKWSSLKNFYFPIFYNDDYYILKNNFFFFFFKNALFI